MCCDYLVVPLAHIFVIIDLFKFTHNYTTILCFNTHVQISSFQVGDLPFTDKTPKSVRALLTGLLNPEPCDRCVCVVCCVLCKSVIVLVYILFMQLCVVTQLCVVVC